MAMGEGIGGEKEIRLAMHWSLLEVEWWEHGSSLYNSLFFCTHEIFHYKRIKKSKYALISTCTDTTPWHLKVGLIKSNNYKQDNIRIWMFYLKQSK